MLVGGSAAGIFLGPKLFGGSKAAAASGHSAKASEKGEGKAEGKGKEKGEEGEGEGEGEGGEGKKIISVRFDPIVVDTRDSQNRVHHLKIGLAAELSDKEPKEEFDAVMP